MKERHWNSLIATLRRGQCILVLGPEIPVNAPQTEAPNAVSLTEELGKALALELAGDGRRPVGKTLAALAQQYEDTEGFGATALRAEAERFYKSTTLQPSVAHELLASIPFPLVLTTCQDSFFRRALTTAGKAPDSQRYHMRGDKRDNPEFVLSASPSTPIIYHLFGEANEPASLVLSENDILDFLIAIISENPPLPNSLLRMLRRGGQSYLFVGFGIRHWHLRVLLKVILRAFELNRTASAIVTEPLQALSAPDREDTILFYQRGTRLEVEDSEVSQFLQALCQRYKLEGGFLGNEVGVGRSLRVFISYAREDSELARRVYGALQAAHFEPWMDQQSLEGGVDWDRKIETELQTTDFAIVLYTPALSRKFDSYVNKEVALARRRAMNVRGSFLIPLCPQPITEEEAMPELFDYNQMPLRQEFFQDDMAKVVSTMTREIQRRNR